MTTAIVKRAIENALKEGGLQEIEQEILDIEKLFLVWIGDRSQGPRKLANATGIPEKKVKQILNTGEFQRRYLEQTAGFREVAKDYTKARATEIMDTVIGRLADIVEAGEDRDAIGAARVLVGMVDIAEPQVTNQTYVDARVLQLASDGVKTIDDVKRIMAASIDGNINRVTEARATKGRQ